MELLFYVFIKIVYLLRNVLSSVSPCYKTQEIMSHIANKNKE